MLGNGPEGVGDGQENTVKTAVVRKGTFATLAMIAAIAAGVASHFVAPECSIVPAGCKDSEHYCINANRAGFCHDLSSTCMKTCGCCSDSPDKSCPNQVMTVKRIFTDNQGLFTSFMCYYLFIMIFSNWRMCCSENSAAKRTFQVVLVLSSLFIIALMLGIFIVYQITGCWTNKFRGISDALLFVSFACIFKSFIDLVSAVALTPSIAQYGALLAKMAAHRSQEDANLLTLEVSADRARSFLSEEEQRGAEVTVEQTYGRCYKCLRIFGLLYFAGLAGALVWLGGMEAFSLTRTVCFCIGYALLLLFTVVYVRVTRTQSYLDHNKHQEMRQWREEIQGPQQVLFFHNVSPGTTMESKSVISFGPKKAWFFSAAIDVPGLMSTSTHTRILNAEAPGGPALEFTTKVHRENPGLLRFDVRAEAVARMPIESHQVAEVQEWLRERREAFNFETLGEVELPTSYVAAPV